MPLKNYGVLKARPVSRRLGGGQNPHYQIHLVDDTSDYRAAVNVASKLSPSELEFLITDHFQHPITADLSSLSLGFTSLDSKPGAVALDFIRVNLFDRSAMVPLPANVPGRDNDLNEAIDGVIQRAMSDEDAIIYVFGQRWGPEEGKKDKIFGFLPGNGVHDIHMNQGNVGDFVKDDGLYQDGALLVHFPTDQRWSAIFLKFQSQSWHTDDKTGHRLTEAPTTPVVPADETGAADPEGFVRIVAALVNPAGGEPESETVTLLNASPHDIDLSGWALADRAKNKMALSGNIAAGRPITFPLETIKLGNKGGIVTLLDAGGLKVHGVSYTKSQAAREGWSIVF